MPQTAPKPKRGLTELPALDGERRFRARIGTGRGRQVNLGVYPTRGLAAFAFNVAAELLHGKGRARTEIPAPEQPNADQARWITARVRLRLGLDEPPHAPEDRPPHADQLLTLLEITVVGFWRDQVAAHGSHLARELDVAAHRLVEAAEALFWSHFSGHPMPLEALSQTLARRLDRDFRRGDLTRAVLDDDGDDPLRVARWLVYPDDSPGGGFRAALGSLYADLLGPSAAESARPDWAIVLDINPPYSAEQIRAAYRSRSKTSHPDTGGDHAEFIRLRAAYEEGRQYCSSRK